MYLATVIDLYSRMMVGWAMSERMTATLACDAMLMVLWRRGMPQGVIFHSLKVEAIHGERFLTRNAMRRAVFKYIEVDYNRTRRHSTNGNLSPVLFKPKQVT